MQEQRMSGKDVSLNLNKLSRKPTNGVGGKRIRSGMLDELHEAVSRSFQAESNGTLEMLERQGVTTSTRGSREVPPELRPASGIDNRPIIEQAGIAGSGNDHVQKDAPAPGRGWPAVASSRPASPAPTVAESASPAPPQAPSGGGWSPHIGDIVCESTTQKFYEVTAVGTTGVVINEPATGVKVLTHADLLNYQFMGRKSGS